MTMCCAVSTPLIVKLIGLVLPELLSESNYLRPFWRGLVLLENCFCVPLKINLACQTVVLPIPLALFQFRENSQR